MPPPDFAAIAARVQQTDFRLDSIRWEQVNQCNLCKRESHCVIAHRDRYGFSLTFAMCRHCGLVYLAPRPDSASYGEFYANHYRPLVSAFHNRLINADTVQAEQLPYAATVAAFVARRWNKRAGMRLLDVGGSTGVVAEVIADQLEAQGVVLDPSEQELAKARARGLETVAGLFEDASAETLGRFDLVLLCQTIDHLIDIQSSLSKIRSLVKDDGLFYVDILDFDMNIRRNGVRGAVKIDHPYYLTDGTVQAFLEAAGFKIIDTLVHPDGIHLGYLCSPGEVRYDEVSLVREGERVFGMIRAAQFDKELV